MKNTFPITIIAFLLLGITLGCGSGAIRTEYVEGIVSYKGAVVEGATISFSPTVEGNGLPAFGTTDATGKYTLKTHLGEFGKGTTPGEYKVTISKIESTPTGRFDVDPAGVKHNIYDRKYVVPEVYGSITSTPLQATVVKGNNKFDFDLVD